MSRLTDLGPGEVLDRLTILSLKIVHGRQKGIVTGLWEQERDKLLQLWPDLAPKGIMAAHYLELAAVNAALWQAEDHIRDLMEGYNHSTGGVPGGEPIMMQAGHVGFRIAKLNDRRVELVNLINMNAGMERPSDKV